MRDDRKRNINTLAAALEAAAGKLVGPDDDLHPLRDQLTVAERSAVMINWWDAWANLGDAAIRKMGAGQPCPQFAVATRMMVNIAREMANATPPAPVTDVKRVRGRESWAMNRSIDYATAYLLACGSGFSNSYGELRIPDRHPNKTIADWFGVSVETARKWKKRPLGHELEHGENDESFKQRVRYEGQRYSKYGRIH